MKNYRVHPTHWLISTQVFAASLAKADPLDGISDDDVRACLLATSGASPALFAPEKASSQEPGDQSSSSPTLMTMSSICSRVT